MIRFDDLSFSYRKGSDALREINAEIGPGIHLLLGENGAGKTTLLHLIDGLLRPSSGSCDIDGIHPASRNPDLMQRCFFLSDNFECPYATIADMARCHAPFYPGFSDDRLRSNLAVFGQQGDEKIKRMSLGTRRKAFLAYALALGVDVLLLDEPANGLDIDSKKELRRMIGECVSEEQTVIISTHTVYDLQSLYDGIIVLSQSRLLLSMPTWKLAERLAFVASPSPVSDALFQEPDSGLFRAIVRNDGDCDTDINYTLLYSALMSERRDEIISIINDENCPNDENR